MTRASEAPAKVNLALHVTGRREDGYHLLDTLAVFTELADRLEMRPAGETRLDVSGPFADALGAEAGRNLVLRAADAFGTGRGHAFHLTKVLPLAAGLGGGSADAAAALRCLQAASGCAMPSDELLRVATALGADVPMCLHGRTLRARGIGEEIDVLPGFPRLALVLVNPRVAVPTGEVFRRLAGRWGDGLPPPEALRDLPDVLDWLEETRNDLEPPAVALQPVIGEVLEALLSEPSCAFARMSGSGATCFGVFESEDEAAEAAGRLRRDRPGWWIEPTPTRDERPRAFRTGD